MRVETDVADASVFLDRIGIGSAPITVPDLQPGPHRLDVRAAGYDAYSETIELEPGPRTVSLKFREITLNASIDVTHKHGIGSCAGQLFATPDGLRFVASDGKDSVVVPFAELSAFDLDYVAKNLRLRTRQGRTLNFTDPGGDANKVFAFHRDVDKVRTRLAKGQ